MVMNRKWMTLIILILGAIVPISGTLVKPIHAPRACIPKAGGTVTRQHQAGGTVTGGRRWVGGIGAAVSPVTGPSDRGIRPVAGGTSRTPTRCASDPLGSAGLPRRTQRPPGFQ